MTEDVREEMLKDIKDGYVDAWDNLTINELFEQIEREHNEIQQYRAIGTVEEFKALKEKNVAKKGKTNKYLVGDRVVYIGNSLDFKGKMGTIIRLAEKNGKEYNQVKFDDPYFIDDDGYKYCDYFCFAENLQKLDKQ